MPQEKEQTPQPNRLKIFTNGLVKENPVLVLALGTCPTLAVSTTAAAGLAMGLSVLFVLVFTNMAVSALKRVVPSNVRLPSYLIITSTLVTFVQLTIKAYIPWLDARLGVYLPLIAVNCLILGRAEAFASRRSIVDSAMDGLGMGLGYAIVITVVSCVREIWGSGTIFGAPVPIEYYTPTAIFAIAPGGFLLFGFLLALVNRLSGGRSQEYRAHESCSGCPAASSCSAAGKGGPEE